jgi:hypothetical protein
MEPRFVLRRDYDRYSILVLDEHGSYTTLMTLDGVYNWQPAAKMVLDAMLGADPDVLPNPNAGSPQQR